MWFLKVEFVFLSIVKQGIAVDTVFIELYPFVFPGFRWKLQELYYPPILFFKN